MPQLAAPSLLGRALCGRLLDSLLQEILSKCLATEVAEFTLATCLVVSVKEIWKDFSKNMENQMTFSSSKALDSLSLMIIEMLMMLSMTSMERSCWVRGFQLNMPEELGETGLLQEGGEILTRLPGWTSMVPLPGLTTES